MSTFAWRIGEVEGDLKEVRDEVRDHERDLQRLSRSDARREEQITGKGGLQQALADVRIELAGVRKAFYALTGTLLLCIVTLAGAIASHAL